ncbi:MAG TPA: RNA 3'-terminal phosphate cyclase, partial [Methanomassiliicoccales archaeon]|nr:RNA 3'-terminal phosphate cyclase [Methanomassiliicoccales archaeon]
RLVQRGFYPQGGGEVDLALSPPKRILALDEVERGHLIDVNGVCFSRNLPDHVCSRMSAAVRKRFLNTPPSIASDVGKGRSSGAGVQLWSTFERTILGADALGERGLPAEKVGENAADILFAEIESGGTLDVHASDQLLPYMALAETPSRFIVREVSGHLATQMELLREFLPVGFEISEVEGGHLVHVEPSHT